MSISFSNTYYPEGNFFPVVHRIVEGGGHLTFLALSALATKNSIVSAISLTKRATLGILGDTNKYIIILAESIAIFASCITKTLPFCLELLRVGLSVLAKLIFNIISTLVGGLYYIWSLLKESLALHESYKTMAVMDRALQASSPEEQVRLGLKAYEDLKEIHQRIKTVALARLAPQNHAKAEKLLDADTESAMEEKFGPLAFKFIQKADRETLLTKKVEALHKARAMMKVRIINHYLDIAAAIAAIAAVIFTFVFPGFGLLTFVAWGFWGVAGAGWASSFLHTQILNHKIKPLLL